MYATGPPSRPASSPISRCRRKRLAMRSKKLQRHLDPGHTTLHAPGMRSEEHTSELQSLMRISYAVFCLKKKKQTTEIIPHKSHETKTINIPTDSSSTATNN